MKKILLILIIGLVVFAMLPVLTAGKNVPAKGMKTVYLYPGDPNNETARGKLAYSVSSSTFDFSFTGIAPVINDYYALVVGEHPLSHPETAVILAYPRSHGVTGEINIEKSIELDRDLKKVQVWLVLGDDIITDGRYTRIIEWIGWQPQKYLFGAKLFNYNDKDIHPIKKCNVSTICGESCEYGGQTYNTVLIGTQCWFKENLNVGTMLANTETPDNTAPTLNKPDTVSKWCYNNSLTYCTNEGGLYTWAEANALPNSCNSTSCSVSTPNQGICPNGWHIPTDAEQYTLENYLKTPGQTCDATRTGWDCSDAGTKLKFGGSSGFDAIGAGNHAMDGSFDKREPSTHLWSSSPFSAGYAYKLTLGSGYDTVGRWHSIKAYGFSVRCLANTTNIE